LVDSDIVMLLGGNHGRYSSELDELRELRDNGRSKVIALQQSFRTLTGTSSQRAMCV
jgi:hypothetical protein